MAVRTGAAPTSGAQPSVRAALFSLAVCLGKGEILSVLVPLTIDARLLEHRKLIALAEALGDPRAWSYPVQLWMWARAELPDGTIRPISGRTAAARLEWQLGWKGAPGALAGHLCATGLLDVDGSNLVIHDWEENSMAGTAALKMRKARRDAKAGAYRVQTSCSPPSEIRHGPVDLFGSPGPEAPPMSQKLKANLLQDLWNGTADPRLPRWAKMPAHRIAKANARLKEYPMAEWPDIIRKINQSPLLLGLIKSKSGEGNWKPPGIDWFLNQTNLAKCAEGAYVRAGFSAAPKTKPIPAHHKATVVYEDD